MSFKKTINEEQEILLEYNDFSVAELIASGSIPLEPGMMNRLGFSEKNQEAYHMTNYHKYLKDMISNQNKKVQLSCFTKGGPELARLPSNPNIVIKLKGTTVIKGKTDIWSLTSVRGRRWLSISSSGYVGARAKKVSKLHNLVLGVLQRVTNKAQEDQEEIIDMYNSTETERRNVISWLSDKEKVALYRLYMKEMEKLLNKHYKVLVDYISDAADFSYDEVILTKWKIIEVKALDFDNGVKTALKDTNVPYAGVILKKDLKDLKI